MKRAEGEQLPSEAIQTTRYGGRDVPTTRASTTDHRGELLLQLQSIYHYYHYHYYSV